ncbi:conserved protein of unknown function [Tenacibaculum sp. 190524A02b]|uniref:DUF6565 domain-containing protein n=1 Tax=Tenacibaculum vairaonense TaxID=3137860 RepID=A0ABP1FBQ7_9FLAO
MKNIQIKLLISILLLAYTACNNPKTKIDYLNEYQQFILKIKKEWSSYDTDQWNHQNQINKKYSIDYLNTFYHQMTPSEIIRVKRYDLAFHFYKGDINIKALLSGKYNFVIQEYLKELKAINWEIITGINELQNEELITFIDRLSQ